MLNWYFQSGKESDVVLSTKIRVTRNISGFPFITKMDENDFNKILQKTSQVSFLSNYGLKFFELKKLDDLTRMSLVEKNILSLKFARENIENKGFLTNDDENICIMINGKDHVRIQTFASGLELESLLALSMELEDKFDEELKFSYNKKYGYLTSSPANVGTGVRASVLLHLPALAKTQNIIKVFEVVNNLGMSIRAMSSEGVRSKENIYQISNKQTLGISEKDIIKNLKAIVEKIIDEERKARKMITKNPLELEDKLYRSYGILTSARKISMDELKSLMSDVRLGVDMGIIKDITDLKVNKIGILSKSANLQKYFGENLDEFDRSVKRSELIKKILEE